MSEANAAFLWGALFGFILGVSSVGYLVLLK